MISESDLPENWRDLLDAEMAEMAETTRRISELCSRRDRGKVRGGRRASSGPGVVPSLVRPATSGAQDDT